MEHLIASVDILNASRPTIGADWQWQSFGKVIRHSTAIPGLDNMNKIVLGVLIVFGLGLLMLGGLFTVTGYTSDIVIGLVMIMAGFGILFYVYRLEKIEASKPTLVSQTFNVKMDGSGKFEDKQMKCRSCGAPITDKNLKVIQGGIMATCPYCGAVFAMQEAPKW